MFRGLLFAFGAGILVLVLTYFATGQRRYLMWARGALLAGLALLVVFFAVLLIKRVI